jgi:hypothetical protein
MKQIVLITTTFYKSEEDIRAQLALKTAMEAQKNNYPLIVVDGGSVKKIVDVLFNFGATVFNQSKDGMGVSRRQAMTEAVKLYGEDAIYVWLEPEKYSLINYIDLLVKPIIEGLADIVIPKRITFDDYPPEQTYAELIGNKAFEYITGHTLDIWYGPKVMNYKSLQEFLAYKGEYGDMWESIVIPVIRAIHKGLRVTSVLVRYTHPPIQTKTESGDIRFLLKRIDQLKNIILAMQKEVEALNLKA